MEVDFKMFNLIDVNLESKMDKVLHYVAKSLSQTGHNSKPVLLHSFKVAMTLYEFNYSEVIVISGALHDLIEDTDVCYEDICNIYGEKIAKIIDAVSFNPKIKDKLVQAKTMYERCRENGYEALIVKCADLLDNINFVNLVENCTIREQLFKKYELFLNISKSVIGQEKIYHMLKERLNAVRH